MLMRAMTLLPERNIGKVLAFSGHLVETGTIFSGNSRWGFFVCLMRRAGPAPEAEIDRHTNKAIQTVGTPLKIFQIFSLLMIPK